MTQTIDMRIEDSNCAALRVALDDIIIEGEFAPHHAKHAAERMERCLDPGHMEQLRTMTTSDHNSPKLAVIRNIPLGGDLNDGPSPDDGRRPDWLKSRLHELFGAGLAHLMGLCIYTVAQEYGGTLNQYLSPVASFSNAPTGRSRKRLGVHSDNVALDRFNPRHISLTGLRRDVATPTTFLDLDAVLGALDPEVRAMLERPLFRNATPLSFTEDHSAPLFSPPTAILERDPFGRWISWFNEYSTRPIPDAGSRPAEALAALIETAARPEFAIDVDLAPGTMVIADNRRTLHARGDIQGSRIVVRQYFTDDLAPLVEAGAAVPGRPGVFEATTLIAALHRKQSLVGF